jgi:hypothetical protein
MQIKSIVQITVKIPLNISPATKEYTYYKESSDLKTFSFSNNTSVTTSSALLRHIHIVAKIAYYLPQGGKPSHKCATTLHLGTLPILLIRPGLMKVCNLSYDM